MKQMKLLEDSESWKMIVFEKLKNVTPKEIHWFWKPFIPFGKVTLIQGDTGIGKTSLMLKIIADLSNGLYPPVMYREHLQPQKTGAPVLTYYVSIENGIADTIVPHIDFLGGNREYVIYQDETRGHFVLTGDEIIECVERTGAKLIVIDPWQQFLDNASSTDNDAIRNMIRNVQTATEITGAAVVLCGNYTKAVVRSDISKGMGAAELFNTLRSVLTVKYGENPSERKMVASKMSFLGKEMTPVTFVQNEDYMIEYIYDRNDDEEDEDDNPADKISGQSQARRDQTADFLNNLLMNGPMDSNDVKRAVKDAGFSMRTVHRIKDGFVAVEKQPDRSTKWFLKWSM